MPLLVLGTLGIFGGILALFLPETLDKELPQTLQDGENFGKGQRFLDFPCCNKLVSISVDFVIKLKLKTSEGSRLFYSAFYIIPKIVKRA